MEAGARVGRGRETCGRTAAELRAAAAAATATGGPERRRPAGMVAAAPARSPARGSVRGPRQPDRRLHAIRRQFLDGPEPAVGIQRAADPALPAAAAAVAAAVSDDVQRSLHLIDQLRRPSVALPG